VAGYHLVTLGLDRPLHPSTTHGLCQSAHAMVFQQASCHVAMYIWASSFPLDGPLPQLSFMPASHQRLAEKAGFLHPRGCIACIPMAQQNFPLVVDPAKDYFHVALDFRPITDTTLNGDVGLAELPLTPQDPTPSAATVDHLQAMFQFTFGASPAESPSSCTRASRSATTPLITSMPGMHTASSTAS